MNGVVQGGWEFVIAAYAVTATALLVYGVSLLSRIREERARAARDGESK